MINTYIERYGMKKAVKKFSRNTVVRLLLHNLNHPKTRIAKDSGITLLLMSKQRITGVRSSTDSQGRKYTVFEGDKSGMVKVFHDRVMLENVGL